MGIEQRVNERLPDADQCCGVSAPIVALLAHFARSGSRSVAQFYGGPSEHNWGRQHNHGNEIASTGLAASNLRMVRDRDIGCCLYFCHL